MLWKWKLARDPDDVLHLLNGETKYDRPTPDARICMIWRGDHPQFWVFATKAAKTQTPHDGLGSWSWKLATEADEALQFLRGDELFCGPLRQTQIAAAWAGDHHRFYVFHRDPAPGHEQATVPGDWGWTLVRDSDDALLFLNSYKADSHPVTTARIATAYRDHHDELFIFYQRTLRTDRVDTWRWQTVDSADGVRVAVDRKRRNPMDFQVAAPSPGLGAFQLFTTNDKRRLAGAGLTGAA
ncbi:MAG TPA: hypothetical protein VHN80_07450 [Kineosporiaceae bacterium]|nr:hypothetical protein [Kineosporiaceae bacterium]